MQTWMTAPHPSTVCLPSWHLSFWITWSGWSTITRSSKHRWTLQLVVDLCLPTWNPSTTSKCWNWCQFWSRWGSTNVPQSRTTGPNFQPTTARGITRCSRGIDLRLSTTWCCTSQKLVRNQRRRLSHSWTNLLPNSRLRSTRGDRRNGNRVERKVEIQTVQCSQAQEISHQDVRPVSQHYRLCVQHPDLLRCWDIVRPWLGPIFRAGREGVWVPAATTRPRSSCLCWPLLHHIQTHHLPHS